MFSKVRYCTSKALYSPRGRAHVRVISVSEMWVAFMPVIGSGSIKIEVSVILRRICALRFCIF